VGLYLCVCTRRMNLENRPPTPNQETVGQHFSKRYVRIYTTSCTCPDTIGIVLSVCVRVCVNKHMHICQLLKLFLAISPLTLLLSFSLLLWTPATVAAICHNNLLLVILYWHQCMYKYTYSHIHIYFLEYPCLSDTSAYAYAPLY